MMFNTKHNSHNIARLVVIKRSNIHRSKLHTACHHPIKRAITSATRASSLRTFTHPSRKTNIIWCAFVVTVLASIFGQLSNAALATHVPLTNNNVLSKGVFEAENDVNNIEDSANTPYYDQDEEDYPDNTDEGDDSGETICFYGGANGNDITCLPDINGQGDVDKRGNYLFRSKKNYLFRSRRAPSYLFRSKKAPSYLFRSRRSPSEIARLRRAPGYLFRSRRAPGYLFRSKKAPSYLFRSKKAPGYLFRSRKAAGKKAAGRGYFFRSRKAPAGYLFRSRRGQGYLFRSRREEQTGDNVENENDPSIATRAGYLFRTRKSYPSLLTESDEPTSSRHTLMEDMETDRGDQPDDDLLNRQLRSRSYLFRTKKEDPNLINDQDDSQNLKVATRGAYLFRT